MKMIKINVPGLAALLRSPLGLAVKQQIASAKQGVSTLYNAKRIQILKATAPQRKAFKLRVKSVRLWLDPFLSSIQSPALFGRIYLMIVNNLFFSRYIKEFLQKGEKEHSLSRFSRIITDEQSAYIASIFMNWSNPVASVLGNIIYPSTGSAWDSLATWAQRDLFEKFGGDTSSAAKAVLSITHAIRLLYVYSLKTAQGMKARFKMRSDSYFARMISFIEVCGADFMHIAPITSLIGFGLLGLAEGTPVLLGTFAFIACYRSFRFANTYLSVPRPSADPVVQDQVNLDIEKYFASGNNANIHIDAGPEVFYAELYSPDHSVFLDAKQVDRFSAVIGYPIENYPLLAYPAKIVFMLWTFPGVILDFYTLSAHAVKGALEKQTASSFLRDCRATFELYKHSLGTQLLALSNTLPQKMQVIGHNMVPSQELQSLVKKRRLNMHSPFRVLV